MNYDAKIDADEALAEQSDSGHDMLPDGGEGLITRRMALIGGLVVLVLVGLWFINRLVAPNELDSDSVQQVPVVTVLQPGRATVAGEIKTTGTLAARRELPVGVVGEGGRVERVLVEPGDWVSAGQVLAVIDRSVQVQQAASLQAQIGVAQADARLAQANLDRALQLVERGFVSKADVDRLTATRDAAAARVRVAQAQLGETRARNNRLNIVAPAAGLVLDRQVEPAQVVSSGSGVLFRIAKGGEMELRADLTEESLSQISTGIHASVTPVGSEKSFTGEVWQISPVIDPQNRQGTVRIALPYAAELRPGGFAEAVISAGAVVAPKLPESAILADDKGSYVYVVGKDDRVVRRNVKTGSVTADSIVVTEGLTGSERVVMRAGAFLSPGEKVKAQRAKGS
ncbi:MAG: efflux RND transporter periplasmic adaptor subunit [Novosphingobium sp.]|nr:efflux RND transporter periplasmic adaptor subunit [Novosphingobium sp.]